MDINIPDIGAAGLVGLLIIITAIVGLVRGFVRMLIGFVSLGIGCLGAYWGFLRGGSMLGDYFLSPPDWLPAVVGFSIGLALFIISRAIFGILLEPTKVVNGRRKNHALAGGFLGLLTGILLTWFLASGARYVGTLAEIDRLDRAITAKKIEDIPVSPLIRIKNLVDSTLPGRIHSKFDFLNDETRAQLAKLKVIAKEQHAVTKAAGTNRAVYDAFAQEDVREALSTSPELEMAYLRDKRWSHLLESRRFRKLARKAEVRKILNDVPFEEALGIAPPPLFPEESEEDKKKTAKR